MVDTVAPGAPTVASFSPDSGKAGDGITNANHITLSGTADASSTVEVFDGATQIGTTTANGGGAWTFATSDARRREPCVYHQGNGRRRQRQRGLGSLDCRWWIPWRPAYATVASFSPDSGKVGDGITNANHITLAGTAAAGSTVEVFDGATQIGTTTANASGAWTFATGTLADGSHAFTAQGNGCRRQCQRGLCRPECHGRHRGAERADIGLRRFRRAINLST